MSRDEINEHIRHLYQELQEFPKGTDEYNSKIDEINEAIRQMDSM